MIEIDGSYGEGGGQIVRTALALSTILGKPFKVTNIRKGRCDSGLKPQHLTCVKALQELCDAKAEGAEIGSDSIIFEPGKIKARTLSIDVGTAGSITLLMQSLLLPAIVCGDKLRLKIKGGTDVTWSMPIDYFSQILLPQLKKYADVDFKLELRGYYPKGGGRIDLKIKGKYPLEKANEAPKIDLLEQGKLIQVKGVSHASSSLMDAQVAERQAKTAKLTLSKLDCPINIRTEYQETTSTGSGITLWAIFSKDVDEIDFVNPIVIGSDSLGERGKRAELVGQEAAERLMNEISYKAPVDEYLADNMMPLLAIFGGRMKVAKISSHTLTNIYIVEQFLGKVFEIDKENKIISIKK
ncbi:MAG: RNA 3'-terminal phosphate cyclase [Nanoarchaeota archaeon]|nr:RNA 3'-terminal phosphate cyclase [Nanoarchaeota archaeon]